ncbi:MAG TPA: hypothetical protein VGG33_25180 [Polyangia bacterium]
MSNSPESAQTEAAGDDRTPRVRLYEPFQHFFIIGFTMLWALVGVPGFSLSFYLEGHRQAAVVGLVVVSIFVFILYRTMWIAKRVFLDNDKLLVGTGRRRREIPLSNIARVEKPWWAWPDRMLTPTEITLREGRSLLFYPVAGAEELLRIRSGTTDVPRQNL